MPKQQTPNFTLSRVRLGLRLPEKEYTKKVGVLFMKLNSVRHVLITIIGSVAFQILYHLTVLDVGWMCFSEPVRWSTPLYYEIGKVPSEHSLCCHLFPFRISYLGMGNSRKLRNQEKGET